ncbi:hypothetical protein DA096_10455 [Vibrio rotiferianus]|nr:hypothetical protein DA095_17610 [Vibrio rotiferianus]TMX48222.1 hypothetical protein DA093_16830 [Vibrio rotiferianus]TMX64175.1 hypothetical protein DA096_10455 [Vibrio rotiferianus]
MTSRCRVQRVVIDSNLRTTTQCNSGHSPSCLTQRFFKKERGSITRSRRTSYLGSYTRILYIDSLDLQSPLVYKPNHSH